MLQHVLLENRDIALIKMQMELATNVILMKFIQLFLTEYVFYVHQLIQDARHVMMEVSNLYLLVKFVILAIMEQIIVLHVILHVKVVPLQLVINAKMDITLLIQKDLLV
jgi:hypothetical protein